MAPSTGNWLGPRLEQELTGLIEWRKRENDPSLSQAVTGDEHNYEYDGSNLWVKVDYAIEDPVLVQVQQFTTNKRPFNCLVSDGFTTVRAKFSRDAAEKLESHSQIDNFAKLTNLALLHIPKFRIMVAPSGSTLDRIQLLIDDVEIVNSQRVDALGNPRLFHLRIGVDKLLHHAEQLMQPVSESEAPAPGIVPTPRRTRVMKNGQYTQEFATQIRPTLVEAGFEMLGGTNLAPPVVPHRNDGAKVFGTEAVSRPNHQNAYDDLMSILPGATATKKTASAVVPATQPFASQPLSQITLHKESKNESRSSLNSSPNEEVADPTSSRSSKSLLPIGPPFDGAVEDAIEKMNNHSYGNPHNRAMNEHEMMSRVGGGRLPVPLVAHEPATTRPQNEQTPGVPKHKDRETSRPRNPSHLEAHKAPQSSDIVQKCKPRSWANIRMRGTKRSDFICPDDQATLLTRPESEYYPRPGKTFPSANIPIELFTQLHETPTSATRSKGDVAGEDIDVKEDPTGDEADDDDEDDEDETSGGQDDEEDEEDDRVIAEFSPTPQKERASFADDLPPESSPPRSSPIRSKARSVAQKAMWNASAVTSGQHEGAAGEPVTTPVYGDQEMDVDYTPRTVDNAKFFSSAVRPEILSPGIQREPNNSSDSLIKLSSGNFAGPSSSLLPGTQRLSIRGNGPRIISSNSDLLASSQALSPGTQQPSIHADSSQTIASSTGAPASRRGSWLGTQRSSIQGNGSQNITSSNSFPASGPESLLGTELQLNATHKILTQSPVNEILGFSQALSSGTQHLHKEIDRSVIRFSGNDVLGSARTMRPPPTRLVSASHLDGADSDLPSEDTSVMAEQQLLRDFKASTHHNSNEVQAPATPACFSKGRTNQRHSPASSVATSRKRRDAPDMSPKELREQKVSRFNFTQESPVSQDPAVSVAKARQEFLKGRRNSKQPAEQPLEVASSPPSVESALDITMLEEEVENEVDDTSLYGEFKRAYPSYNGTMEHFESYCKSLAASCRKGQLLCHPMLWDDYIARSDSDYMAYTFEKLRHGAQTVDPYEKFYNEQIEGSLHEKKVVTRTKLVAWFGPEALHPFTRLDSRGSQRPGNFDKAGSAQRHSTPNMGRSESVAIKQKGQGAERASPWITAGKVNKGFEWWRKP